MEACLVVVVIAFLAERISPVEREGDRSFSDTVKRSRVELSLISNRTRGKVHIGSKPRCREYGRERSGRKAFFQKTKRLRWSKEKTLDEMLSPRQHDFNNGVWRGVLTFRYHLSQVGRS